MAPRREVAEPRRFVLALLFAALTPITTNGQTVVPSAQPPPPLFEVAPPHYWANRGRWNFGAQVGYSLEYGLSQHEVSHIQMLIGQPQIGFIVRDFRNPLVRRFEIVTEGIIGGAVHPGASLIGVAWLLRFDGRNRGRWVPFLDAGAGVERTPLSEHIPELNGYTQFSPQGGLGMQYFIRPQRAFVLEVRTVHMSNADITPPNMGFNSIMFTLGFRWLRRPLQPAR